jgi:hypothetical protein
LALAIDNKSPEDRTACVGIPFLWEIFFWMNFKLAPADFVIQVYALSTVHGAPQLQVDPM